MSVTSEMWIIGGWERNACLQKICATFCRSSLFPSSRTDLAHAFASRGPMYDTPAPTLSVSPRPLHSYLALNFYPTVSTFRIELFATGTGTCPRPGPWPSTTRVNYLRSCVCDCSSKREDWRAATRYRSSACCAVEECQ
ncbi:hypothetical protein CVT25_006145 [Psilocybe cyanescens]|uniref:Uncharacterized protein n=1 Tax=Psilocybe cyanescens TaxID=93625 RepID=A0A409WZ23_PSICY|nr:hypothetical protein CVT25_006145 [Psilocybe cyanescens]